MEKDRLGSALFIAPFEVFHAAQPFFANLARMRLIYRWPDAQHPARKHRRAQPAGRHGGYALGLISNRLFGAQVDADRAAVMALYHDSSEVLTGICPPGQSSFNPEIAREYKKIELAAEQRLLGMLPPEAGRGLSPLLDSGAQDEALTSLVKDAETPSAPTPSVWRS